MFTQYVLQFGDYIVQPINDPMIIKQTMRDNHSWIMIISSTIYKKITQDIPLTPLMVMSKDDSILMKDIIVYKKNSGKEKLLNGCVLASSRPKGYIDQALTSFPNEINRNKTKIVIVPRDMDALMSIVLDVAQVALVSEDSLLKLSKLNATQEQNIARINAGKKMLRPILAVSKQSPINYQRLVSIFQSMDTDPKAQPLCQLLGMTKWQNLSNDDKKLLD